MGLKDNEIKRLWRNRDLSPMKMIQCIAELSGCHYNVARNRCEALGLIQSGEYVRLDISAKWSIDQVRELYRLWHAGYSSAQIAEKLRRSKRSVDSKLQHMKEDRSIFQ